MRACRGVRLKAEETTEVHPASAERRHRQLTIFVLKGTISTIEAGKSEL
jgi:hypothetical protein